MKTAKEIITEVFDRWAHEVAPAWGDGLYTPDADQFEEMAIEAIAIDRAQREAVITNEDGFDVEYIAARDRYLDARHAHRTASIAEIQRLLPEDVLFLVLNMSDDPDSPRLTIDGWVLRDGQETDTFPLEEADLYNPLDQIAADMDVYDWEDASSLLLRHPDRRRFVIERPTTPGKEQQ